MTDALSLNRYLYCQNDPVNFIDPSGMAQTRGQIARAAQTTSSTAAKAASAAKSAAKTSSSPVTTMYASKAASAAAQAQALAKQAKTTYNADIAKKAAAAAAQAQMYSNLAANSTGNYGVTKTTDGGNSQREAQIYCGGSSSYTQTYTSTPGSYSACIPGSVEQPVQKVCSGGRAQVQMLAIKRLNDYNKYGSSSYLTNPLENYELFSAAEMLAGVTAIIYSGGAANAGGALISAGYQSLLNGVSNENAGGTFGAGYWGGQVSGLITGYFLSEGGGLIGDIGKSAYSTSSVVSAFAKGIEESASWGTVGGAAGDIITQLIDTGTVDIGHVATSGITNGVISGLAVPYSGVASAFGNTPSEIVAKIIISVVNEVVFDSTTSTISAEGVGN